MGVVQPPRPRSAWALDAFFDSTKRSGSGGSLKKSIPQQDTFLSGMRPAISVAQVFGLLPVAKASDAHNASFHWKSLRVLFSLVILLGALTESVLSLMRMMETGVRFITSVNVVFYTTSTIGGIMFLCLSTKWRQLISAWANAEQSVVQHFEGPLQFRRNMLLATCSILSIALVEHLLSICSTFMYVWPCYQRGGLPLLVQGYFLTKYMKTFTTIKYAFWKGVALLALQLITTFIWNFLDLFIMLVSLGIGTQFRKLNQALEEVRGQRKTSTFWKGKRELYTRLSSLTKYTDAQIGPVILLSYASNLYFICLQCVVVTKKRVRTAYLLNSLYFYFSLIFLIMRTTVSSYVTALVYDESQKPKDVLYNVPSEGYCCEVQRFLTQVTTDTVALSGCSFFSITRSFILTVAGTVVTYLVVLIQFDDSASDPDSAQSNNTVVCTCSDLKAYGC